jgi:hypothetical protein
VNLEARREKRRLRRSRKVTPRELQQYIVQDDDPCEIPSDGQKSRVLRVVTSRSDDLMIKSVTTGYVDYWEARRIANEQNKQFGRMPGRRN